MVAFLEFKMCVSRMEVRQNPFSEVYNLNFKWSMNSWFKFRQISCACRGLLNYRMTSAQNVGHLLIVQTRQSECVISVLLGIPCKCARNSHWTAKVGQICCWHNLQKTRRAKMFETWTPPLPGSSVSQKNSLLSQYCSHECRADN